MSGANVAKLPTKIDQFPVEKITITPELATELLERNGLNRPLNEQHVARIARQIKAGKWRFNGETIKIADTQDVFDGQHRLWAVIEAKQSIDTLIIYGLTREAFATIDTLSKPRSGADVLALNGAHQYRSTMASALQWLIRWQRNTLLDYRNPKNRVENSDIEEIFAAHGGIVQAAERATKLRRVANPSLLTFLYYVMVNRNAEVAERMMRTLEYPAGVGMDDPFFCLRSYLVSDHQKTKQPLTTIALTIKAANAAYKNQTVKILNWRNQGERPEAFPELKIDGKS